jgi:hypothetical protein
LVLLLLSSQSYAGVVMDFVTKNALGQETERTNIFAQSNKIRMDEIGGTDSRISMIFLGSQFLVLNHKDKSYFVLDEASLDVVTSEISAAMQQMQAQLASLSPEQRAMAEQMMKRQMGGVMGQESAPSPAPRVEAVGTGQWQSYTCKQYAVYEGAEKIQDVCTTALNQVEGTDEVMQAFRGMAEYVKKMTESMPMGSVDALNPGELMDQIDGFPVHTIEYRNGEVAGEVSLESITEQALDEGLFAAPQDYLRQDPFAER